MIGETISHFKIINKLGQGGMGEVFLAEDTRLDRQVALKFLPESMHQDSVAEQRSLCEAESAAALHHPFACNIYEAGEEDGKSFISMEYVQGKNLKHKLEEWIHPFQCILMLGYVLSGRSRNADIERRTRYRNYDR